MSNVAVKELVTKNPVITFTCVLDTYLAFRLLVFIIVVDIMNWLLLIPYTTNVEENIRHYTLFSAINHIARLCINSVTTCISSKKFAYVIKPLRGYVVTIRSRICKDFVIGGSNSIVNSFSFYINKSKSWDVWCPPVFLCKWLLHDHLILLSSCLVYTYVLYIQSSPRHKPLWRIVVKWKIGLWYNFLVFKCVYKHRKFLWIVICAAKFITCSKPENSCNFRHATLRSYHKLVKLLYTLGAACKAQLSLCHVSCQIYCSIS